MERVGGGMVPSSFEAVQIILLRPQLSQPPLTMKKTKFNGIFIPHPQPPSYLKGAFWNEKC